MKSLIKFTKNTNVFLISKRLDKRYLKEDIILNEVSKDFKSIDVVVEKNNKQTYYSSDKENAMCKKIEISESGNVFEMPSHMNYKTSLA